ncbi:hypothetical protein JB92DRAFT_3280079 [Gautieria morchelliformis]|nr:hypothetical protein JB92DRAFT_3280079 [Gautieria morchelliformis]
MCTELTPILACVVPTFDSLLAIWIRMRDDPSKSHLSSMLDGGNEKLSSQYNERRFSKSTIIAMTLHPSIRFRWIENNWPEAHKKFTHQTILSELGKYNTQSNVPSSPDSVAQSGPPQTTYKVLFGQGMNTADSNPSSKLPSIKDGWSSYCHAANWPDFTSVDLIEWWDDRLDFTGSWKSEEKKLEQENEYEDQGLSAINGHLQDESWDSVEEVTDKGCFSVDTTRCPANVSGEIVVLPAKHKSQTYSALQLNVHTKEFQKSQHSLGKGRRPPMYE